MQLTEVRIAGFGGQGVILSAIVLGKAASIYQGAFATMTPELRPGSPWRRLQRFNSCFPRRPCSIPI